MAKKKTIYICSECGYESTGWLGKCPNCQSWNSFQEFQMDKTTNGSNRSWLDSNQKIEKNEIVNLEEISGQSQDRLQTGIKELDRVLGGGFVKGSLVLVGGDPGIGKSTLLLQVLGKLNYQNETLYISGEESPAQIKMRADRLGENTNTARIFTGTSFTDIAQVLSKEKPDFAVIDSIQTIYDEDLSSAPGTVSQIRETTAGLLRLAKRLNIAIVLVGHVTKEGGIAGPRILEHMVDAVLYFEGERSGQYRILRSVKNRFGTTDEIGIFEMTQSGLQSVKNPGEALLIGRPLNVPGTTITACLEGTRVILLEIQALLNLTDFNQPIRNTQGIDRLRLIMLLAILQKSCQIKTGLYDAYVNVTGGMKINETAADLAVVMAIVSSTQEKPIDPNLILIGELGLSGEIRNVPNIEKRVLEAISLGWRKFIVPASSQQNLKILDIPKDCEIIYAGLLQEALDIMFF